MERPVLVTGAGGFIGRHLVSTLRRQGTRVRALVRRPPSPPETDTHGEPVVGDLLDPGTATSVASGVRGVFHLAGRLYAPGASPVEYERLHVNATMALLQACIAAGGVDFFVLCSTSGVLGPTGERPAREDDPGQPQNAYERSKAHAEQSASEAARRAGLALAIARPGLVYGPGDLHLLGLFRAIRGGYYRVIGSGTNRQHPIYIDDLVRGLLLMAQHRPPIGRAYHLVGPRPVSMRALSEAIGGAVGRKVSATHLPRPLALGLGALFEALPLPRRLLPLSRSRVRFMTQSRVYDGSRALLELGFAPRIDLDEGLARTVAWYSENGLL